MTNVSTRSVPCWKITEKMDKSFCRGNVSLFPAKNLFSARAAKKCPKNVPAKFQGCAIFVRGVFSKRSLNDAGQTFFLPEVFPESPSLKTLAVAMDLWHAHAILWRFSCLQCKTLATCHSRLGAAPCTIGMSTSISAGNLCFIRQKLLWRHFSRSLSMWFFSLLCWALKWKNSVSFKSKSNFNPSSSYMWKLSPFKELVPVKKFVKDFTFGGGCTVATTSRIAAPKAQSSLFFSISHDDRNTVLIYA